LKQKCVRQGGIIAKEIDGKMKIIGESEDNRLENELEHAAMNLINQSAGLCDYILTGLEVYLYREPCIMCSMALSHSRVKNVFYIEPDPRNGALGSKDEIHALSQLNHRFNAFSGGFVVSNHEQMK